MYCVETIDGHQIGSQHPPMTRERRATKYCERIKSNLSETGHPDSRSKQTRILGWCPVQGARAVALPPPESKRK